MEKHFELTDLEFETQFADRSLNPRLFTHEAHLRLAWIHITKYGISNAIDNVCAQIQAFASFHSDNEKYHMTVTVAAVRAVYHFILKSKADNFQDFIAEHPRLKHNFMDLLHAHYKTNIFKSAQAKQTFLEPDLEPFDEIVTEH